MRTRMVVAGLGALVLALGVCSCGSQRAIATVRAAGNEAFYDGQYEAAEVEYQEIVDRRPQDPRARYDLARTQVILDKPVYAREHMIVATHLDPYNDRYLDLLAEALFETGSETDLRVFLERQATDVRRWPNEVRRGTYLAKLGDADEAERALKRAARIDQGRHPEPQIALADFYGSIGDEEEQVRRLRMALGADPRSSIARERLRSLGIVPGPTIAIAPEESRPSQVTSENPDAGPEE